jgi:uncharacterized protein (TIGR02001 family)
MVFNISFADSLAVSGDMTMASTYIWRGVKQYDGVAMQGTVDGTYSFLSVGVWFSTVNFGDESPLLETDPYIAVTFPVSDFELSAGLVAYMYDFTRFSAEEPGKDEAKYEYELFLGVGYDAFSLNGFYVPKQVSTEYDETTSKYWLELSGGTSWGSFDWGATFGYGTYSSRWLDNPKKDATGAIVISASKSILEDLSISWNYSVGIDTDMNNYLFATLGYGF